MAAIYKKRAERWGEKTTRGPELPGSHRNNTTLATPLFAIGVNRSTWGPRPLPTIRALFQFDELCFGHQALELSVPHEVKNIFEKLEGKKKTMTNKCYFVFSSMYIRLVKYYKLADWM